MHKRLALLLSPLFTFGLVYWLGIYAVLVCFAIALCTLLLSAGERDRTASAQSNEYRGESTFAGSLQ